MIYGSLIFPPLLSNSPTGAQAVSLSRFVDHTQLGKHTHAVELLWIRDQPVAEAATYTTHKKQKRRTTSMPSAGFEPGIPAVDPLQTYALDRAATGIGADPITTYNKETSVHGYTFELCAAARRDACRHVPNKLVSNPGQTHTISCNPLSCYILLGYNVLK